MRNDIYAKQNTSLFMERLRAQGYLYDQAKTYAEWVVLISVIAVFGLTVLKYFFPQVGWLKSVSILYGIMSTVVCFVLEVPNVCHNRVILSV